jgi:hypothetical protein
VRGRRGTRGRGQGSRGGLTDHRSGLGQLLNPGNSCFAVSAFLGILTAEFDLHLNPAILRDEAHRHLDTVLRELCHRRRDPSTAPFSVVPLIDAVNESQVHQFLYMNFECAVEFMEVFLSELQLLPDYLVTHLEVGTCQECGARSQQVSVQSFNNMKTVIQGHFLHDKMLQLAVPDQAAPVSVSDLVTGLRTALPPGQVTLTCLSDNACQGLAIQMTQLRPNPGNCTVLYLLCRGKVPFKSLFTDLFMEGAPPHFQM